MIRIAVTGVVVLVAVAGCASPAGLAPKGPMPPKAFATEEQKLLACLDLRDHIVDLYADDYVTREGLAMSRAERNAFRNGWAEELAKRGTFERFEQSCFSSVTPGKYRCGMTSSTTDVLVACMKLGSG
jgi:hypothetical protein